MKAMIYKRGAFIDLKRWFAIGCFVGPADRFVYIRFGSLYRNGHSFTFGRWYDGRWCGHHMHTRNGFSQ